ncbi:GntR family transcriptional regulator [Actinocatenispora thailandica]|uniref:GntR family transcriptional regulator n=1 Tax=Actinocatenispora thailandica TaxID=227318 RepID=A0A7R7DMG7_9ACTN|nr:GntR family transcriptional regulator [Actinocatenispora thailandica]BCJ34380.1 GntR family transcriptional regulator [Actinocatenispora thailandica]
MKDSGPIFAQIADRLTDEVADGTLAEGERIPSTNELATFHRVNPATAARALSVLVDEGIAEKRRGVGMFVAAGARERLMRVRRRQFADSYVRPLVTEANRLGLGRQELLALVRDELAELAAVAPAPARSTS